MPSLLKKIKNYLSLIRFSHTVFALPFAFIGFTIGVIQEHKPFEWLLLLKMLLCMVFARTAAMAFNRYLDRRYDALNPRTAMREIPAGVIKASHALLFTFISSMLFVVTTWFINTTCFYLSFVALFVILFYSYTKRFTALCHLVLGVGLSLAPLGAYIAVTGKFDILPILFSASVITWVSGFDIIYALQDATFDRQQKLHSIPAAIGIKNALLVSIVLHLFSAAFVVAAGVNAHFGIIYWIGTVIYIIMLTYQHVIVKPNDLSKVNKAFANTNGIASITFAAFTIVAVLMW